MKPVLSKVEGPVLSKVEGSGAEGAVEIFTDGACKGNPGLGGWGALLVWGERNKKICGGEPHTTNNRMELTAVIEALRTLKRPCKIKLHTDSQYVKQGITAWIHDWKRRGWKTTDRKPVKNQDLWQELDRLASGHQIEWIWVKGHAGHDGNEQADALANKGVENVKREM